MQPAFVPPRPTRRLPSSLHSAVEEIEKDGIHWCQRFGMLATEERTETFKLSKFGWLGARAYWRAGFEEACLATHYLIWLFMNDDWTDALPLDRVHVHRQHLLEVLAGEVTAREAAPTVFALHDVMKDVQAMADPRCLQRFKLHIGRYVDSMVWETQNRQALRIPALDAYLENRLDTGAMESVFDMVEISQRICVPDEVLHHEVIAEMRIAGGNLVNWSNDIVSMAREARQGDVHNLVLVLRHHASLTTEEAARRAIAMYDQQLERFLTLERRLPSFGAADGPLRKYVAGLCDWVQGNDDWAWEDSLRYSLD